MATPQELQSRVEQAPTGKAQTVIVLRDGKRAELKVSPLEMPGEKAGPRSPEKVEGKSSRFDKLGMEVQNCTPELAKKLKIKAKQGVVVTDVQTGSMAERAGLSHGAVIVEAGRKPMKSTKDLAKALDEKSMASGVLLLPLLVERHSKSGVTPKGANIGDSAEMRYGRWVLDGGWADGNESHQELPRYDRNRRPTLHVGARRPTPLFCPDTSAGWPCEIR